MTGNSEIPRLRAQLNEICARHLSTDAAAALEALTRPAIRLVHNDGPTRSHLGGPALLDDEAQWPHWQGRPLSLLAVIDLSELKDFDSDPPLPTDGTLNFFYDNGEQPWGFRPSDRGGWRVIQSNSTDARPVSAPEGAKTFVSIGLAPQQILSVPHSAEPVLNPWFPPPQLGATEAAVASNALSAVEHDWQHVLNTTAAPHHQIGGWPLLQQGTIWPECDVVSRGLPLGDTADWERAEPLFNHEREANWRLLFQIDTDDEAGWMWGDVGTLYFTVYPSPTLESWLEEGWMVLQCG